MNSTRIALLITILIAGVGLYFAGEKVGFSKAVAQNNAAVAKITEEALNEQARLQQITQEQSYVFNKAITAEKLAHEHTKSAIKDKPTIQNCVRDDNGVNVAVLTSGTVGVLEQARSSEALQETNNTVGVSGQKDTATANDLAAYSEYSISEYNQCAIQLNALIDVVNNGLDNL